MISDEVVLKVFHRLFDRLPDSEELFAFLNQYGSREGDREVTRVHLAILKLCEGDPDKLRANVEAALIDYRDVLAWAEYPEQMKSGKTAFNSSPSDYQEIVERDRAQYLEWLDEHGEQVQ